MSKSTKKVTVKNTSENTLAFSNVPQFEPGEVREVETDVADRILIHRDMEEVKKSETTPARSTAKSASSTAKDTSEKEE